MIIKSRNMPSSRAGRRFLGMIVLSSEIRPDLLLSFQGVEITVLDVKLMWIVVLVMNVL